MGSGSCSPGTADGTDSQTLKTQRAFTCLCFGIRGFTVDGHHGLIGSILGFLRSASCHGWGRWSQRTVGGALRALLLLTGTPISLECDRI